RRPGRPEGGGGAGAPPAASGARGEAGAEGRGGRSAELHPLLRPQQREELATRGRTVRDERPARARAALLALELREPVRRQRAALRPGLHPVETRRVEPEDQSLRPLGESRVPEPLL